MKLALLNLLYCTTHAFRECVVKAKNIPDCQTICDTSSQCEAWVFKVFYFFKKKRSKTFDKSSNGNCYMKNRDGWKSSPNSAYAYGFKNAGPWYEKSHDLVGGANNCN